MEIRAVPLLALAVVVVATLSGADAESAGVQHFDALKSQVANDLLALEQRIHSKQSEVVESVESKILQEVSKLKKSVESFSKGSESDSIRKQLNKIQTELTATKDKLDKTNEKIRLLQAENVSLKEKLDSLKEQSYSAQWKVWHDHLSGKWYSMMGNTATFVDAASYNAMKFSDFAKTKSAWMINQWNYLYDQYFQYAVPVAIKTSEKIMAWAHETHQKWRPTLDQHISRLHGLIQQHPKLSEYQLEKYITVETVAAIVVVLGSVILRLLLPLCCRRSKQASKTLQSPTKH